MKWSPVQYHELWWYTVPAMRRYWPHTWNTRNHHIRESEYYYITFLWWKSIYQRYIEALVFFFLDILLPFQNILFLKSREREKIRTINRQELEYNCKPFCFTASKIIHTPYEIKPINLQIMPAIENQKWINIKTIKFLVSEVVLNIYFTVMQSLTMILLNGNMIQTKIWISEFKFINLSLMFD